MMGSTRAGVEASRILCESQKDKLSCDFFLFEEDTATKDVNFSDNNEDADESSEPEPTTSKKELHSITSFKFKWSKTSFEITEPSNMKTYTSYSFQAKLEAQNVTKFLDAWSLLFPEEILKFEKNFEARIHISNTKDKYGIKVIFPNAEMLYRINAELYIGPNEKTESESEPSYYIRKLSEPLHKTERNITCDNWFTFVEIVENIKQEYLLTMVGALNKKKIGNLPSLIDTALTRDPHFAYLNDHILVSRFPKSYKVALLLSSLSKIKEIIGGENQLKIMSYDWTKGRTKMFHKVCQTYSTALENKSWLLHLFFGKLDQAVLMNPTIPIINVKNGQFNPLQEEEKDQAGTGSSLKCGLTPKLKLTFGYYFNNWYE